MRIYLAILMACGALISLQSPLSAACAGGACNRHSAQETEADCNYDDCDEETPDEEAACYYYFYNADLESTWYDEPVNNWPGQHEDSWYDYFTR